MKKPTFKRKDILKLLLDSMNMTAKLPCHNQKDLAYVNGKVSGFNEAIQIVKK